MEIIILRFTKLPCGCAPSPFIINTTLMEHMQACIMREENKAAAEEMQDNLFVNDLTSGGVNEQETHKNKNIATRLFAEGDFTLHKWHSIMPSQHLPQQLKVMKKLSLMEKNNWEAKVLKPRFWESV